MLSGFFYFKKMPSALKKDRISKSGFKKANFRSCRFGLSRLGLGRFGLGTFRSDYEILQKYYMFTF